MPGIVLLAIVTAILRAVREVARRSRGQRHRGLCAGCAFVHMQYGATGRNSVFCTFGGGVRPVTIDVLYCTDFRSRYAPIRTTRTGFVPVNRIEAGT